MFGRFKWMLSSIGVGCVGDLYQLTLRHYPSHTDNLGIDKTCSARSWPLLDYWVYQNYLLFHFSHISTPNGLNSSSLAEGEENQEEIESKIGNASNLVFEEFFIFPFRVAVTPWNHQTGLAWYIHPYNTKSVILSYYFGKSFCGNWRSPRALLM